MPDYLHGSCVSFAIALHDLTGWKLVKVTEEWNVHRHTGEPIASDGSAMHWAVEHPSGQLLDINGLRPKDDVVRVYDRQTREGEKASWGYADREDAIEEKARAGVACKVEEAQPDAQQLLNEL